MAKFIGLAAVLVVFAIVLGYIGVGRPALLWESAKIQNLVRRVGEGGASAVFLGLAAINLIGAIFIVIKGRTAG